ncbi:MAG TPA: hypothetical protein VIE12_01940 [Actinomycetota bacterium]
MLGLGGPPQAFEAGGEWDFVPVVIAIVALILLRVLFRMRIGPVTAIAVVLAAPLFRAVADAAGFARTVTVTLVFAGLVALPQWLPRRRLQPPG